MLRLPDASERTRQAIVVIYFCFIESDILSVPHMEPLAAANLEEARQEAEQLLYQHASGQAAHVFKEDDRLLTIRRPRGGRIVATDDLSMSLAPR
ncbi:MAG: hypothetical protein EON96_17405 [Caulobacteraceae bacterium]|nr:MAG: hypothetical protein EON96_17405 [Caulobacteraceae bacterium]